MRTIRIADVTLRENASLTFKEKIEMAKQLEKLRVDVIEVAPLGDEKADALALRTMATIVKDGVLSCPVGLCKEDIERAYDTVREANRPRLSVVAPVSSVQMEYLCHKKPQPMLDAIKEAVAFAKSLCADVEFAAKDATRAEPEFLATAVKTALEAGATCVTLCDTAGESLPEEIAALTKAVLAAVPEGEGKLGVECNDALHTAQAATFSAILAGASEAKAVVSGDGFAQLCDLAETLRIKSDGLGVRFGVNTLELQSAVFRMSKWLGAKKTKDQPFDNELRGNNAGGTVMDATATIKDVTAFAEKLGYDLSKEDTVKVFDEFSRVAARKEVSARDMEAIIASTALQVPETYRLVSFVSNNGNTITSTCSVSLEKEGELLQGVGAGDGPIDAAFLTIEQILGHHYELDDFQIQAVTEGRGAVGEALVKLRADGRLYSGRGVSTDIIGASIRAYLSALNKIVYEERA